MNNISQTTFSNVFSENVWISIKISLKCVSKGSINHIPALVHIMAWRCSGDKPLSEPNMVSLPAHICVTRPQWVNQRMYHRDSNAIENSLLSPQFYQSYHYKILYMISLLCCRDMCKYANIWGDLMASDAVTTRENFHGIGWALVQVMTRRLFGAKSLPAWTLTNYQLDT